jgi:hypothetical protein
VVTDKYCKKHTITNWGKPCIWLNNKNPLKDTPHQWKKDWLEANCVFINLEHRLYLPSPIIPEMFHPQPRLAQVPPDEVESIEEVAPSPLCLPTNLENQPPTFVQGNSRGAITYLEDIDPYFNSRFNK